MLGELFQIRADLRFFSANLSFSSLAFLSLSSFALFLLSSLARISRGVLVLARFLARLLRPAANTIPTVILLQMMRYCVVELYHARDLFVCSRTLMDSCLPGYVIILVPGCKRVNCRGFQSIAACGLLLILSQSTMRVGNGECD